MINTFERTDVMAVEDDLALEFVPVLLDLIVLNHNDYHIEIGEELVEIVVQILNNVFLDERFINLKRTDEGEARVKGRLSRDDCPDSIYQELENLRILFT